MDWVNVAASPGTGFLTCFCDNIAKNERMRSICSFFLTHGNLPSSRCHYSYSAKIGYWELWISHAETGVEERDMMLSRLSANINCFDVLS